MRREPEYELSIGDGVATIRRRGSRAFTTARVLGREEVDGIERVWLDRRVVRNGAVFSKGWRAEGAVSTIMVRPA